ncbi:MAG: YbhB/YbcL family Raf kinase inhibitor-like protein [bacterium]
MQPRRFGTIIALTCVIMLSACSRDGRDMQEPSANQQESIAVTTTAGAVMTPVGGFALTPPWAEGAQLDARFTCAAGISPSLTFQNVATDVVTLALSIVDETANNAVQWIVANIQPTQTDVAEGAVPTGAIEATNALGTIGFGAPCPPAGETHTYRLTGYGLSQQVELENGVDSATLLQAIELAALDTQSSSFIVTSN